MGQLHTPTLTRLSGTDKETRRPPPPLAMIHLERILVGGVAIAVAVFLALALAWTGDVTGSMRERPADSPPTGVETGGSPDARAAIAGPGLPDGPTHVVRKGETLWSIAGHRLGSGGRWREILDLNRERVPDPTLLAEGTVLVLP